MDKLNRIMALDIGDKRIGVALSDPFGLFVSQTELVITKIVQPSPIPQILILLLVQLRV